MLLVLLAALASSVSAGVAIDEYRSGIVALKVGEFCAAVDAFDAAARDNRYKPAEGDPYAVVDEIGKTDYWTPHFLAAYAAYMCAARQSGTPEAQAAMRGAASRLTDYIGNYPVLVRLDGDSRQPAQAPVQAHYLLGMAYRGAGSAEADSEFAKALDQLVALAGHGKPSVLVDLQAIGDEDKKLFTDLAQLQARIEEALGGPPKLSFPALSAPGPGGGETIYLPIEWSDSGSLRAELTASVRWFRGGQSSATGGPSPSLTCDGVRLKPSRVTDYDWRAACSLRFWPASHSQAGVEPSSLNFEFAEPQRITLAASAGGEKDESALTVVPAAIPPPLSEALSRLRKAGP